MKRICLKMFFLAIVFCVFISLSNAAYCANQILSVWNPTAPTIDGVVNAGEWDNAAQYKLTHGKLFVQNDNSNLYLLIDVLGDTTNNNHPADSILVVVDIHSDRTIVPFVDTVYYGLSYLPSYMWYGHYDTTNHWATGETTNSVLGGGFGPTSLPRNHRFWEMSIDLSELGIDTSSWLENPSEVANLIRFGLEIQNVNIWLDGEPNPNVETDFSDLFDVFLDSSPSYAGGYIFKGVGLIPSTKIVNGYATTDPGYYFVVEDAPFGGTMHIFGDFADLRSRGAVKYQVLYSKNGAPYEILQQSWTNYLWISAIREFVLKSIQPDKSGRYSIPPAFQTWYLEDLLMTWNSKSFGNGTYQLKLKAFDINNNEITLPTTQNLLTLEIDNTAPTVNINNIFHDGTPVDYCAIVDTPPNAFTFEITATDNEKHLRQYRLSAYYGDNESQVICTENYSTHNDEDGPNLWDGDISRILPAAAPWSAPVPCAYQFRLSAWGRSINGYTHLHYSEYTKHIAILLP